MSYSFLDPFLVLQLYIHKEPFLEKREEHCLRTYMSKYVITLSSVLIDNFTVVVQLLSHVQLCNPMDCSTSGFLILYYLPEFA